MDGKKILKTAELGNGYILAKLDDGEICFLKVITPDGLSDDLVELLEDKFDKGKAEEKKGKKEETSEDTYTWDDLKEMDYDDLKELVKDNDLDTDPEDYDEDEKKEVMDFRKAIAEEVGIEVPEEKKGKKDKKSKKEEKKEDVEDDTYTWDDLKEMDYDELADLCEEQDLTVDPEDYDKDEEDKLRAEIAEEMDITVPVKTKKRKK